MKLKNLFLFMTLLGLFSFASCQEKNSENAEIDLTVTEIISPADGFEAEIAFTSVKEWQAVAKDSWIAVTPASGDAGEARIIVKISASDGKDARESSVELRSDEVIKTISIKQMQQDQLVVAPSEITVKSAGEDISFNVGHNVDFKINISCDWIKQSATKAYTDEKVVLSVAPNEGEVQREALVEFVSNDGKISQKVNVIQMPKAVLAVTPESIDVKSEGGEITLTVKHNVEYKVSCDADWITASETKACAEDKITFFISENTSSDPREASIAFTSKDGTLSQTILVVQQAHQEVLPEGVYQKGDVIPEGIYVAYRDNDKNYATSTELFDNTKQAIGALLSNGTNYFIVAPTEAHDECVAWLTEPHSALIPDVFTPSAELLDDREKEALADFAGKANTQAILKWKAEDVTRVTPAATVADAYEFAGETEWYLPSVGQLMMIVDNEYDLNNVLALIDGNVPFDSWNWYWSSTQDSDAYAWYWHGGYGQLASYFKGDENFVRAVCDL